MWFHSAIIYSLDVKAFYDSNGDGIGDLKGLIDKLDYINSIGCNCIWLLPFYPSPKRDNGYDVTDYYNVDPVIGSLGDFVQLMAEAEQKGIRIIIDLVANHTSTDHPWFKDAESSRDSRYRDYYVWDDDPVLDKEEVLLEGEEESIWEYSKKTDSFYLHRFHKHQADLNLSNPKVINEILNIMDFWLRLGISGFRVDAAHVITDPVEVDHINYGNLHVFFEKMNDLIGLKKPDAVLIGEASVPTKELVKYFISKNGEPRLHILFNFIINKSMFLAFARENGETINEALDLYDEIASGFWLNFARHHDELNLDLLSETERKKVWDSFAPDENMRIYGHGIRRRIPPMFKNDQRKMKLFYAIIFGLPGIPMINFGEEIGMGDNLQLKGRESVRTPMQWSDEKNAGFSIAPAKRLYRPVIKTGEFSYKKVNVRKQHYQPDSFLNFICRLISIRKNNSIISRGLMKIAKTDNDKIAAWYFSFNDTHLMLVYNVSGEFAVTKLTTNFSSPVLIPVYEDTIYAGKINLTDFNVNPYGFRWIQVIDGK